MTPPADTPADPAGGELTGVPTPERSLPLEVVDVRQGMFGVRGSGDTSGFGGLVSTVLLPGPSERPYGSYFDEVVDVLTEILDESGTGFANAVESVVVDRDELTLNVAREHLVEVSTALRDDQDLRFELSLGVSGVHYPHDTGRELHAVYHLRSITHTRKIRVEVAAPEDDPTIPSTVDVYPTNDWHERETFDFFGIVFTGRSDLSRIEMPDDWPGHPQRKDYPLGGIPVEYKGATVPPADQRRQYR
ncbi:MAG TPA: NADH-quinone oxidoreductase subunit C [Cellulomonas sp.]